MIFDQPAEPREQPAALRCGHAAPRTLLKRATRRLNSEAYIFGVARRNRGDDLACGGGQHRKSPTRMRRPPCVVDENAFRGRKFDVDIHTNSPCLLFWLRVLKSECLVFGTVRMTGPTQFKCTWCSRSSVTVSYTHLTLPTIYS